MLASNRNDFKVTLMESLLINRNHHHLNKNKRSLPLEFNCAKECHLNRAKPREVKDNSYELSKKANVRKREVYRPSSTLNFGAALTQNKCKLLNRHYTERGQFY